jgi:hypothetical protein
MTKKISILILKNYLSNFNENGLNELRMQISPISSLHMYARGNCFASTIDK